MVKGPIYRKCIFEATGLVSSGENPQYDRALVELVAFVNGGSQDDFLAVARDIFGRDRADLWQAERPSSAEVFLRRVRGIFQTDCGRWREDLSGADVVQEITLALEAVNRG